METINSYDSLIGTDAYDVKDKKIGEIAAVYSNGGRPDWLAIRTGFFGLNTSFAPASAVMDHDGQVHLPYTKNEVRDAPNVKPNGCLTSDEEHELFDHYAFVRDARRFGVDPTRTQTS